MQISEKLQGFPGPSEGKYWEQEKCEKEKETVLQCTDITNSTQQTNKKVLQVENIGNTNVHSVPKNC